MPASDNANPGKQLPSSPEGRIVELQNPLDRALYHPVAAYLARSLARTVVTPNMVSVLGGLAIVLAGIAYIQPAWPLAALAGLCLHMSWHVFDGADGDLARRTGRVSASGEIIDGICDYAGHTVLYVLLAAAASREVGPVVWVLAVAAGVSRVIQANFYEVQRRQYAYWAYGVGWLRSGNEAADTNFLAVAARTYLRIASFFSPPQSEIDDAATDPSRAQMLSRLVRDFGPRAFAGSSLLGANYRTLVLGVSMLLGSPLWFFAYEAVVLNIVIGISLARSRRTLTALNAALQSGSSTVR
ncbi:CDP-alcohol phosphatidyltransferase family protein [Qipengyuania sp. RANM35]|uniref:CDP-alcohol phosphatidyltransferase family protein n=1 Tax=Qipengyuania sp. RANM35 TaxID=3068635 RepID=UPI0034DAE6C3